jgi:hypothetical protein
MRLSLSPRSPWSHAHGVPGNVIAQLIGHTNVDVTLNVYTQVLDGSLRAAVDRVGDGLFTIVHQARRGGLDNSLISTQALGTSTKVAR